MSKKEEITLRRKTLLWLAKQGYTRQQAADAVGVCTGVITTDFKAMNIRYSDMSRLAKNSKTRKLLRLAEELSKMELVA